MITLSESDDIAWISAPGVAGDVYAAEPAGGMLRIRYRCCADGQWTPAGLIPVRSCERVGIVAGKTADGIAAALEVRNQELRDMTFL